MKITTLVGLVVVTGAVGGAAFYFANQGKAVVKSEVASQNRFVPDLVDKVNQVTELSVKKANKQFTIKRTAEGWEIAEKGGYPAKAETVKELMVSLAMLRTIEPKTSKPENYAKIGVEDPGTPTPDPVTPPPTPSSPGPVSAAALVTLKDDKGQTIASVIVGNGKWDGKPGVYVRKAGDAQSWLADGQLSVPSDLGGWVDPQPLSIMRDRIKFAQTTHPGGEKTTISREKKEDHDFTVHDIPPGEELMGANAGDSIGAALAYITFEDVRPVAQVNFEGIKTDAIGKPGPSSEFLTFDGMKILVQTAIQEVPAADPKNPPDEKVWAHFIAVYDETAAPKVPETGAEAPKPGQAADKKPDEVQKEVAELNAKTAKWAFQLPAYKASGFKTTVKNMLKNKPPAPPPSLNEGNQFPPATNPPGAPIPNIPPPSPAPTPAPTGAAPSTPPANPAPQPVQDPKLDPQSPAKPPADPPKPNPGGG